jgi:glycerol-3-phosphate acyltransferase PlsY
MPWLIVVLSYLIGSIPTAYIAGRLIKGKDIRHMGDANMGAQNAFRQLGAKTGVVVGLIDAGKGVLVILVAQRAGISQWVVFLAGAAVVMGHNFPAFLGFRGGRGEATTIGILYTLMPWPALIVTVPGAIALAITRNVTLASAVAFVSLPPVAWALHTPGALIAYSIVLLLLVAFTHFLRTRRPAIRPT